METLKSPTEGRVLLRNVSWETYERLIAEREERPVPRFFYDLGVLESLASRRCRHPGFVRFVIDAYRRRVLRVLSASGNERARVARPDEVAPGLLRFSR